jgi:hypothetical protein
MVMLDSQPFLENKEAATLAQAIVDTVREPLLVLDKDLGVLAASRSFYLTFKLAQNCSLGRAWSASAAAISFALACGDVDDKIGDQRSQF